MNNLHIYTLKLIRNEAQRVTNRVEGTAIKLKYY